MPVTGQYASECTVTASCDVLRTWPGTTPSRSAAERDGAGEGGVMAVPPKPKRMSEKRFRELYDSDPQYVEASGIRIRWCTVGSLRTGRPRLLRRSAPCGTWCIPVLARTRNARQNQPSFGAFRSPSTCTHRFGSPSSQIASSRISNRSSAAYLLSLGVLAWSVVPLAPPVVEAMTRLLGKGISG